MNSPLAIGVDLGTSAVKAILMTQDGGLARQVSVALEVDTPKPGWSEQSPDMWTGATLRALAQLCETGPDVAGRVTGLALSGQMHGAVFLDREGLPLRPAILWNDQRSVAECSVITDRVGSEELVNLVGNQALAGFTAPKLLWVRNNEPHIYDRAATVLLPKDYVNFRLTGSKATEPSDASGTLLFDVRSRKWSEPLLKALDIDGDLLPPLMPSSAIIGHITAEVALATGLRQGTPVVAGGADNACAALGLGIIAGGDLMVSIGTSGTVLAASDRPLIEPKARLHTFCHVLSDTWYSMGVILAAGASLRWFRDTMWSDRGSSNEDAYDQIMETASTAPIGSEGLIFLPYLSGERTPHADSNARGVYFGLSLRHDRSHLARATIEGITFALNDSLRLMDELGITTQDVRMSGGGARSMFWVQLVADVLGKPVRTAAADLGPAFGAAILAGVGTGMFTSAAEAAAALVTLGPAVPPDPRAVKSYQPYYELFRGLYPRLSPAYQALAQTVQGADSGEDKLKG